MHVWTIALALLLSLSTGCVSTSAHVAAFGDSVTWGYGGKPGGWVEDLEDRSGISIANLGIPGETSDDAADRIESRLGLGLAPAAEVVIVLHGGNDMNQAFHRAPCNRDCDPAIVNEKFEEIGRNLERIRDVAENHGRRVVFATYWPPSPDACSSYNEAQFATFAAFVARVNQEIVGVAEANGAPVVHLDDLDLPADPKNYYDCLHPSGQGYTRIAKRFLEDLSLWAPEHRDAWSE